MVLTAPKKDIFDESGPSHLTHIDWTNEDHRRSVAASLVQGTYMLETDRQAKREGPQALAPPWYEFFHYQLVNHLVDDVDSTIFAAVYEHIPPTTTSTETKQSPHYVIAFRGTLTNTRDLTLDLHIINNNLDQTSRFHIAIQSVRDTVSTVGRSDSNIWLTGHSLGSSLATLVGREMAKAGIFLTTFLFNPPFFSAPLERIGAGRVKHGIRVANSVLTAGLAYAMKKHEPDRSPTEDRFLALAGWVPSLFVNRGDHICSEYIGYFEHRNVMEEIGVGAIEKLATRNSIGGLVMSVMGKELMEPMHLLPSARVSVNVGAAGSFREAHGIHQWWRPGLDLESKVYKYVQDK